MMTMADFIEVARTADLPAGSFRSVNVDGRRVVVYHTANGFFATDNTCPHRGGPLAEGDLIGEEIICPWHLWSFRVDTGINPGNPEMAVRTHAVRIDGDKILVRLSQSALPDESETAP